MIELFDENFGLTTSQILHNIANQLGVAYDCGEIKVQLAGREYLMFIYLPECRGLQETAVGAPSFFEIKTIIPFAHASFSIRKSDATDWLAEHLLANTDFKAGDSDFDAKFHIRVENTNWGTQFFANSIVRQGISDLLSLGFDAIRSEDGFLKAIKWLKVGGPYPKIEVIKNAVTQLDQLISNVPDDGAGIATGSGIEKEPVDDQVAAMPTSQVEVNSDQCSKMQGNDGAIIDEETAQSFGCLFFLVIWCPIIWVVLMSNKIQIPSPRLVFWGVAVLVILLFFASFLIDMFIQIVLSGVTLDKYLCLRRKFFPIVARSGDLTELIKKNGRSGALLGFIFLVCCYIGSARFLYFITFGK
ncbi:MAG: hypothetical protein FIA91_10995 [Geobacter sp.]|nr:hypothetical protein [Geobacter sp.]